MDDRSLVLEIAGLREKLLDQLHSRIVGQEKALNLIMVTLLARGHALITGVPGLAKTLLVRSLAEAMSLTFARVQFTPDLMPADITGTEIIEEERSSGRREFKFVKGPLFANLVLADEVNRTPPRTQAALLQAMQEYAITVMGKTWPLDCPFHVFATQNPIEHEGTYPLPEALLDRFLVGISMTYPSEAEEREIVRLPTAELPDLGRVVDTNMILQAQSLLSRVPVSDAVGDLVVSIVRSTRPLAHSPKYISDYVSWGAGPRAAQALLMAARADAVLAGEPAPLKRHVLEMAVPVLAHRMVVNFRAETERVEAATLVKNLVNDLA